MVKKRSLKLNLLKKRLAGINDPARRKTKEVACRAYPWNVQLPQA